MPHVPSAWAKSFTGSHPGAHVAGDLGSASAAVRPSQPGSCDRVLQPKVPKAPGAHWAAVLAKGFPHQDQGEGAF